MDNSSTNNILNISGQHRKKKGSLHYKFNFIYIQPDTLVPEGNYQLYL